MKFRNLTGYHLLSRYHEKSSTALRRKVRDIPSPSRSLARLDRRHPERIFTLLHVRGAVL